MITFRLSEPEDIHDIARHLGSLFEEVEHTLEPEDIAEMFDEIEDNDHHSTLLAIDEDGDIVGILTIAECLSISAGGKYGVINELYVVPEYRSEGVGKMLIDQAKELAVDRDWRRLELTTPGDEFSKTLRFYEREGFYKIGPRYCYRV